MTKLYKWQRNASTVAVKLSLGIVGLLVIGTSSMAAAQTINQFRPAELARDGFVISRPDDQGHLRFGGQLHFEYNNDPLVYEARQGDSNTEVFSLIEHQMAAHLTLSLGLWDRLVLFAGLPVNIMMKEEDGNFAGVGQVKADGAGIGDAYFGARLRLLGEREDVGALALQVTGTFPTAELANSSQLYSGDHSPLIHPELLMELRGGGVRFTGNVGARFREARQLTNLQVNDELTYGVGLTVPIVRDRFDVMAEAWGSTGLQDFSKRENSPLEALGGVKYYSQDGFTLGASGGAGILRGYGSPDFRVMAMVGYGDALKEDKAPEPEPMGDRDGDGLLDDQDQCPDDPEDQDSYEDQDGCPDPDNDQDGVLDVGDGCPLQAEDMDGFEDEDGCPDPDNDQDGILDGDDSCPTEAEDQDGFEDEDGCPDPDNDQDSVLDADDKCPTAPGAPEDEGCPKAVRIDTEKGQIIILERVEFATNKDRILKQSYPLLQEVYNTLKVNPQLKKLRVEGHTDDRGRDKYNMKLSQKRAESVMTWLVNAGIEPGRIEAYGCGEARPIDSNKTAAGRQTNRRVEFHIVEPAPAAGARSTEGCELVTD
ncbi:MAG: OmpA family protein [Myxococcales bacterium]|nr:MAG: OmpA family protein [Myxococcales bacterium]